MNSKIIRVLLVGLILIMLFGTISASAITPYTSYTYSVNGVMQRSPHAYTPSENITSAKLLYSLSPEGGASENGLPKEAVLR